MTSWTCERGARGGGGGGGGGEQQVVTPDKLVSFHKVVGELIRGEQMLNEQGWIREYYFIQRI